MPRSKSNPLTAPIDEGVSPEDFDATNPMAMFRALHGMTVQMDGIPLFTPSLLVRPAFPLGEAVERDPIEPDPFMRKWPNRPHADEDCTTALIAISVNYHDTYFETWKNICVGATPAAAYAMLGILPHTVKGWISQGSTDIGEGKDTYFSRFSLDMTRAIGIATQTAQILLYANSPKEYLSNSLGQSMGEEHGDPKKPPSPVAAAVGDLPSPPHEEYALDSGANLNERISTDRKALQIAAEAGITPARILKDHIDQYGEG